MSFLLLLLFLFTLYANPALLMPGLDALRPAQLAGAGAVAILAVQKVVGNKDWRFVRPESYLVILLLAAAVLSALGAFWPRYAAETALDLAKIVVIYFLIVNSLDTVRRLQAATATLVVGGMFPALGTLKNFWTGNLIEGSRAGWVGTFANPNDLAYSLVILIPLVFHLATTVSRYLRPLLWIIFAAYVAAIFAAQSRGGMLGLFAVLALIGLRQRSRSTRLLAFGGVVAAILFATVYWTRDVGFGNLEDDFTVNQRVETIMTGLRMFMDYPLLGVGLGCSVVAWPLYASTEIEFDNALVTHNTAIQALSELGLVGFVPFALLFMWAIVHLRRLSRLTAPAGTDLRSFAVAYEVALWGYIVCGLSGGYVVNWFPYIILGLASALICLSQTHRRPNAVRT